MTTNIIPISDLRRKTRDVIDTVHEGDETVYITQHGRPVVVLVDYERYEQLIAHLRTLTEKLQRQGTVAEPTADYTTQLAGLHREIWEDVDTDRYLQEERNAWNDSSSA